MGNSRVIEATLGDVLERVIGGGTPSREIEHYYSGHIPWATVKDLKSNKLYDTLEHITDEAVSNSATNVIPAGTVIMATRIAVGKCFHAMTDMAINQDLKALIPKKDKLLSEYLLNWLEYKQSAIEAMGTGTTVKGVRIEHIKSLPILLPPLPEQRKIAAILTSVDDTIAATQRIIDQTEHVKRGLMQQLLTRGIGHTKFKKTEIGEIPEEWRVVQIRDIANVKGGKRVPKGYSLLDFPTPYPYIRVSDFVNNTVDTTNIKYASEEIYREISRYTISKDDVYMSIAGTLGLVGIIPPELDGALLTENAAKIVIKNKDTIDKDFLVYVLDGDQAQKQISSLKGVTGVPKLGLNKIEQIRIPVPELIEQKQIAIHIKALTTRYVTENKYFEQLKLLKQALIHVLLTGKVRVKVDEEAGAMV